MSEPAVTPWAPPALSVITKASAQQEYDQAIAGGRQQGYQDGLQQGLAEGRRQAQAMLAEMSAIWEAMQSPFLDLETEVQTQLLGLSVAVARAVIDRELAIDESAIEQALSAALTALGDVGTGLQVVLNPDDRALVQSLLEEQRISAELIDNPNMMRGGCKLRRGGALVDASIESRLMAAIETLALDQNSEIPAQGATRGDEERALDPDQIAAIAARFTGADHGE